MRRKFALLGTITYDRIRSQSGFLWQGLGGVLYQAATFMVTYRCQLLFLCQEFHF